MEKFWMIYTNKNDGKLVKCKTYAEASDAAKRAAHLDTTGEPVFILEAVMVAQRPMPDVEVRKLT